MKAIFRKTLAGILAATLLLAVPGEAKAATSAEIQQQISSLKDKKSDLQSEINAMQSQYDASYGDMASMVERKNTIDQEMTLLNDKIEATNQEIAAYGQLIADTQVDLDEAEAELDALSQQHRERIRAMEEQGGVSYWEVIFEANSFMDLLDRINMIEEINASDRRRIEQMRIVADVVNATRDGLEAEKENLDETRLQLAEDEEVLKQRREESSELLIELEQKTEEYAAALAESEAKQDELMLQIAAKEKEYKEAKYNEELRKLALQGQNPPSDASWKSPVSGYTLTSAFGMRKHPVLGVVRMHNGVDMACSEGTPIYATRAGNVTQASFQAGGAGNYVSINHLDGFSSVYMHMTHYVVSVGQTVSQGQLIGYVGSTGLSTGPHLHFGVSYAGTYVNPLAYIL